MRTTIVALGALGIAGLAGCANQPAGPAFPVTQSQPRAGTAMPAAWGATSVTVRAFAPGAPGVVTVAGREPGEVTGASCELASPYSTARFTAPATVAVPDLGPSSPVLDITCARDGATGRVAVQPALRSTNGGLGGVPTIGVSVGAGTGGWSGTGVSVGGFWGGGVGTTGPNVQEVVYPDARVDLR